MPEALLSCGARKPGVDFLIAGSQGLSGGEETGALTCCVIEGNDVGRSAIMRLRTVVLAAVSMAAFAFAAFPAAALPAAELPAAEKAHEKAAADTDRGCAAVHHGGADYVVCRFDPKTSDIRLFLNDAEGGPYGHFNLVNDALAATGERLVFAMNAGMYHEDRSPVGLYVEDSAFQSPLNDNDGPGNFHLKPNGVFLVTAEGAALVEKTDIFQMTKRPAPRYATQSGPMLVINDRIHPRFLKDSESLKRRNGVGVTREGEAIFVLADSPVRFYDFAAFFRDELQTPNALYLDGTISRLYAPELERNDPGAAMGPIVGVVAKHD